MSGLWNTIMRGIASAPAAQEGMQSAQNIILRMRYADMQQKQFERMQQQDQWEQEQRQYQREYQKQQQEYQRKLQERAAETQAFEVQQKFIDQGVNEATPSQIADSMIPRSRLNEDGTLTSLPNPTKARMFTYQGKQYVKPTPEEKAAQAATAAKVASDAARESKVKDIQAIQAVTPFTLKPAEQRFAGTATPTGQPLEPVASVASVPPKPTNPSEWQVRLDAAGGDAAKALKQLQQDKLSQRAAGRSAATAAAGVSTDDAGIIADAIISGDQPPDIKGLYRMGAPVRAAMARKGFNYTKANLDWQAVQKHVSTLNGAQQERLRQAITFTYDSLDVIENLYEEWQKLAPSFGFKVINKGALALMKNMPGKPGAVATNLEAQINDLTSELGTVYKGGNSSTDESLKLAAGNLKADWNAATFKKALGQIRLNLTIRKNSILHSKPAGLSAGSQFAGGGAAPPGAPTGGTIRARDPQGKLHEAPAGTPLPAGWKAE